MYLVKYVRRLVSSPVFGEKCLSICFSCRHYPLIPVAERHEIVVEDETDADITTYVQDELRQWAGHGLEKTESELLRREIVSRA